MAFVVCQPVLANTAGWYLILSCIILSYTILYYLTLKHQPVAASAAAPIISVLKATVSENEFVAVPKVECVCVLERERECVCVRERERVCVCVCVKSLCFTQ
jgi:hypothetical protein